MNNMAKDLGLRTRSYQQEMFERSMRGNVIVTIDTGSGKTHIAVLRIAAELERCPYGKVIWFLAPTVALCTQQHETICAHLPAVRTRLLVGSDNVDRWSDQGIWDDALKEIRVVVSTHAVLGDALSHGFVKLRNVALLVFDEAHHCGGKHPANRIMQDFYHPLLLQEGPNQVPKIMGLTASPIFRSSPKDLLVVESNLNAISATPRINRPELLRYVHRPTFHRLTYTTCISEQDLGSPLNVDHISSLALKSLCVLYNNYAINDSIRPQLKKFRNKAIHIYVELGHWAVEFFVRESIAVLRRTDLEPTLFQCDVRPSLLRLLDLHVTPSIMTAGVIPEVNMLSHKVSQLVAFLQTQDHQNCSGLIFVRQRVSVSVLCSLLMLHPDTKDKFQCATFVGQSNNASRRYSMAELLDLKAQNEVLQEFRAESKNIVIATDVLEEGIDVTVCNLVVCFDPPANLKSFIQRRGRARDAHSDFVIMLPDNDTKSKIHRWQALEEELIKLYQDEQRTLQQAAEEDPAEEVDYRLTAKSTGALLTADSTVGHLHHFCNRLPHEPYVDHRPVFSFHEEKGLITAVVTLPTSVNPAIRETKSQKAWKTERAAAKDAAFQAYAALYHAGLINDNLLPLVHDWEFSPEQLERQPAMVQASAQYHGMTRLAELWLAPQFHQTRVLVKNQNGMGDHDVTILLTTPIALPAIPPFELYLDEKNTFTLDFGVSYSISDIASKQLRELKGITHALHNSTSSQSIWNSSTDFVVLLSPEHDHDGLANLLQASNAKRTVLEIFRCGDIVNAFVHGPPGTHGLFRFQGCRVYSPMSQDSMIEVDLIPLPKRRKFLVRGTLAKSETSSDTNGKAVQTFSAEQCTVETLPYKYAQFGQFIPSIMRYIDTYLVAHQCCVTILKDIKVRELQHIVTALSAPSAQWVTHYQRYEFIGDSVLKFLASIQLYADNPNWPEGYLTQRRTHLISNTTLTHAARERGLDQYIMTTAEQERKWKPHLVSDKPLTKQRVLSSKMLADVVEALIGASYIDSGFAVARACIHTFVPHIRADAPDLTIPAVELTTMNVPKEIAEAENLIRYQFRHKAILLEALTHPTRQIAGNVQSYQRLEFLGDAVLDMVITDQLLAHISELSQGEMTHNKAALVNQNILGFLCLDFHLARRAITIQQSPLNSFIANVGTEHVPLWKFMYHNSPHVIAIQQSTVCRYEELRDQIREALARGTSYPWSLLARLGPEKFYSDIIESITGAIFVDSRGDLSACKSFVEAIGLLDYANHLIKDGVDVLHPKVQLQRRLSQPPEYVVEREDTAPATYRCKIVADGVAIAEVEGCLNGEMAVLLAIDVAMERVMDFTTEKGTD